jgi:hypothetical protein
MGCQGWSHARLIAVGALSSVRHRTLGLTRVHLPYYPPSLCARWDVTDESDHSSVDRLDSC